MADTLHEWKVNFGTEQSKQKNTAAAAVADFELGVVVLHDKHMLASTHNE